MRLFGCLPSSNTFFPEESPLFTRDELATLVAALRFWRDEMLPQDPDLVEPYFDGLGADPLPDDQIDPLLDRLRAML